MREKGFFLPLVLMSILVIVALFAIFFRFIFKPTSSPSSTSETIVQKSYFQQLLSSHCDKQNLSLSDLPLSIDQSVIKVNKVTVLCPSGPGKAYVKINFDNDSLLVYDDLSDEYGHGGEPWLGSVGTIIKENEDVKITFYLSGGHGAYILGDISVTGRGMKKILINNDEVVYVNYDQTLIREDDTRLISLLKKYAITEVSGSPDVFYLEEDGIEEDIFNTFFSDLSNVEDPEKTAISRIEQILSLVEAK